MKPSGRERARAGSGRGTAGPEQPQPSCSPVPLHPSPNLPQPDLVARAPCGKGHPPTLSHLHPAQFLVTSLVAVGLVSPAGVMILEVSALFSVSPKTPYPCQGRDWFLLPSTSHDVTPKGQ